MKSKMSRRLSEKTIARQWQITLGVGAVVLGVVALLLRTLARTVDQIELAASKIWYAGKLIANNTVHVPLLYTVNQHATGILRNADGLARAVERLNRAVR